MSCKNCHCTECQAAWYKPGAPIHTARWQDATPATREQAETWGKAIDECLNSWSHIGVVALLSMVTRLCHVKEEDKQKVSLQICRFIKESPKYKVSLNGFGGGTVTKDFDTAWNSGEELPVYSSRPTADINPDNYTCKGCGNKKLSTQEKSCWRCGREVGK
jgi:hypothetical protein